MVDSQTRKMKLLVIVVLSVMLFGLASDAAPRPQPQVPGTLEWFCAPGSGQSPFGDWLKNVVQPWLPPAVCQNIVQPNSTDTDSSGASGAASWLNFLPKLST